MSNRHHRKNTTNTKALNFLAFVIVVIAGIAFAVYYRSLESQRDAAEWQRMAGANALIDVQQAINREDYRFLGVNIQGHVLVPGNEGTSDTEKFGVRTIRGEGEYSQQSPAEQRRRQLVEQYMRNYNSMLSEYIKQTKPPT